MKISDSLRTPRAAPARGSDSVKKLSAPKPAQPIDAASIGGIPEAELTPKVREVLFSLLTETQLLREELKRTRAHVTELEAIADSDPMLGVLNRRAFVRELNRTLAMAERYKQPSSLLFIDLDNLKPINDRQGHAAGDAAIKHVADVLGANIRQTDVLGRLGGDEFGIILTQVNKVVAEDKAAALKDAVLSSPASWQGEKLDVQISCGVVEVAEGLTADAALTSADQAMYAQKRQRRV